MTIKALLGAAIAPLLTSAIAPVKDALTTGTTDPSAALGTMQTLLGKEVLNIPSLEGEAISAACQLGLDAIGKMEEEIAKLLGAAPASPPAPAPAPALESPPAEKGNG